jgi:hypothetical protein
VPDTARKERGFRLEHHPFAALHHDRQLALAGVPFYLRTGKRLARKVTEVAIHFSPHRTSCSRSSRTVQRKCPGVPAATGGGHHADFCGKQPVGLCLEPVTMNFRYASAFGIEHSGLFVAAATPWAATRRCSRADWIYRLADRRAGHRPLASMAPTPNCGRVGPTGGQRPAACGQTRGNHCGRTPCRSMTIARGCPEALPNRGTPLPS